MSTYKLARQFGIHRFTVVKHLQRAGIDPTWLTFGVLA
jgi:hypothetical protein